MKRIVKPIYLLFVAIITIGAFLLFSVLISGYSLAFALWHARPHNPPDLGVYREFGNDLALLILHIFITCPNNYRKCLLFMMGTNDCLL